MEFINKYWSDIKGNVKYDAVKYALLAAGSTVIAALYRWIQHLLHMAVSNGWVYAFFALLLFIASVLCAIGLTLSRRDRPELKLLLGPLVWLYREDKDLTVFFVLASIINKGEPSVAINWRATYRVGDSSEEMELFHIQGSYVIDVGHQRLTLTNENLVNLKTLEMPIQRGQSIGGRVLAAVPGDRTAQIRALRHEIVVEAEDYLGVVIKATFSPAAQTPKSLLGHFRELREPLEEVVDSNKARMSIAEPPARELPPSS